MYNRLAGILQERGNLSGNCILAIGENQLAGLGFLFFPRHPQVLNELSLLVLEPGPVAPLAGTVLQKTTLSSQ